MVITKQNSCLSSLPSFPQHPWEASPFCAEQISHLIFQIQHLHVLLFEIFNLLFWMHQKKHRRNLISNDWLICSINANVNSSFFSSWFEPIWNILLKFFMVGFFFLCCVSSAVLLLFLQHQNHSVFVMLHLVAVEMAVREIQFSRH